VKAPSFDEGVKMETKWHRNLPVFLIVRYKGSKFVKNSILKGGGHGGSG
jgi:hypothetical protein